MLNPALVDFLIRLGFTLIHAGYSVQFIVDYLTWLLNTLH